jgi:uncharacterized membrane protein
MQKVLPALHPTEGPSREVNLGELERTVSLAVGSTFAILALNRLRLLDLGLAVIGFGLLQRGITGHCALYTAVAKAAARRREREEPDRDMVDVASAESFPASDAPAWSGGAATPSVER